LGGVTLSTFDQIAAITQHSAGLADAARGNLDAPVEHCPGWTVADLVHHVTDVHWFWGSIVEGLLATPPSDAQHPPRAAPDDLVPTFVTGAARLVEVLREADQSAPCWTWAGWRQDVAFVTRHQVQEIAVHHWDAVHAAGDALLLEAEVAADCVDEFLHFSVASDDDPDEPTLPPLAGTLAILGADVEQGWTLTDGTRPGTVLVTPGVQEGTPVLAAPVSDLLLWLYGRVELDTGGLPADLVARFRGVCFTD
jgi:uncharacterized protein (TIGR03083 family)